MAKSTLEKAIEKQTKQAKDAQRKQERAQREAIKRERASSIVNGQPMIAGFRIMDETAEIVLQCLLKCDRSEGNRVAYADDIFPEYVHMSLGLELEKLVQYGMVSGVIDYMGGGWCYILPPAINYFENKAKALVDHATTQTERSSRLILKKLINKGSVLQQENAKVTHADCAQWTQDVRTFNDRMLKAHPAHKSIEEALFFCNIESILGYLQSVYEDSEFWRDAEEGDIDMTVQSRELAQYDVFISHANKDKIAFVDELKASLDKLGITIFYDKDTLEWGDNWKSKILQGVEQAEFAIIVISDNFFGREWTEKELTEFLARQNRNGQKIILPIVHGITMSQLQEQYPDVAEIQALDSSQHTCDDIALRFAGQLIKRLKV